MHAYDNGARRAQEEHWKAGLAHNVQHPLQPTPTPVIHDQGIERRPYVDTLDFPIPAYLSALETQELWQVLDHIEQGLLPGFVRRELRHRVNANLR